MKARSAAATAALNVSMSVMLLVAGIGGGAAVGLLKGPNAAAATVPDATNRIAAFAPVEQPLMGGLTIEEGQAAPAAVRRTVRRVVTQPRTGGATAAQNGGGAAPSLSVPGAGLAAGAGPADCARLDDPKVAWLLRLAAKAKAANPDQAEVAARVEQQLTAAYGRNMCAQEAQIYVGQMCAEAGTKRFMEAMVKELPFFVRPLVGDPCKHDLVAAAERWLPST